MKSKSRFSDILTAERSPEPEAQSVELTAPAQSPAKTEPDRGPGRPRGRRSSTDYQSVTTFLHRDIYRRTRIRLLETDRDFGDLVDELLREWLLKQ